MNSRPQADCNPVPRRKGRIGEMKNSRDDIASLVSWFSMVFVIIRRKETKGRAIRDDVPPLVSSGNG